MKFLNHDITLTEKDVAAAERQLGLTFPQPLRALFLENNGAVLEPYVLRSEAAQTVVNETLPLVSGAGRETAIECYQDLVVEKAIVARKFFPFAADVGGDYFFIDCDDSAAAVYLFISDSLVPRLEKIADSLADFLNMLEPEEE